MLSLFVFCAETWFKSAMSEKLTPGQKGHLFEFFQIPVVPDGKDYYIFKLKPDHELPSGVTQADFCDPSLSCKLEAAKTSSFYRLFDVPRRDGDSLESV